MEKKTYVYLHRRKDTGQIFYIGIGVRRRAYQKIHRNDMWHNVVNKYGYTIEIIHRNLTQEEAFDIEIKLIKKYGRRDLGLGYLVNMTDGGEGKVNCICSEEQKELLIKVNGEKLGRKVYLYELYSDEVLTFNAKRDACRFLVNNNIIPERIALKDNSFIRGEYLVKENYITQEEKIELIYNTPQIDLKVLKVSMDFTEVIKEYSSARDAARENNCINILSVLDKNKKKHKSTIGFRWVYKVDYVYKGLDYLNEIYGYKRKFNKTSLNRNKVSQ
jgi:hypothetical protein